MHCFFRISIAGSSPQTIVFELFADICPITCNNFLKICKSKAIAKRPSGPITQRIYNEVVEPTYRGTEIHRVIPNFMIQGGDFTLFDGKGGYAHPSTNSGSETFADENFSISHSADGILSMANRGKNTNGSQFFITLNKCLHLDGKHVAFGRVVDGIEVVREVAKVETECDRPVRMQKVVIVDCGEGWGKDDIAGDSSRSVSSQSSRSERGKKRSKHKKRKHRYRNEKKHHKHSKRHRQDKDYSDDEFHRHKKKKRRKERSRSKHREKERSVSSDSSRSTSDDERHRSYHRTLE